MGIQPTVEIARKGQKAKVVFSGILYSAENVNGAWTALTNADTPHVADLTSIQGFYRAAPYGTNSIFSSHAPVVLKLTGPFQARFDMAFAGTPDGIFPPAREKPYFDGTLVMPGWQILVSIRVRGNSSLQECPFPKLKFKVSSENRARTPFADAREVKIGTHCAEGGRGNIGRLRDQTATFREALAYEVLDLMQFIAPRVRRARVEYQDSTPPTNSSATVGWNLTREALLLDDIEVLAARLGGRPLSETELLELTVDSFESQLVADMQFFHALIGNWDYDLGFESRGVWNTDVLEFIEGTTKRFVPVAGDFDLASWVTGVPLRDAPQDYHPELGDVERETMYELEQIRMRVAPAYFSAARQRFADKRAVIESKVLLARLDEEGRANALRHIAAFYDAIDVLK